MAADTALLERLRERLTEVESRQRAAGGATPEYLSALRGRSSTATARTHAGTTAPGATTPGMTTDAAAPGGAARSRRRGRFSTRPIGVPEPTRGRGPWSGVSVGDMIAVDPLDVRWIGDEGADVVSDPSWRDLPDLCEQREPRRPEPVTVMIDAVAGMSLRRHDTDELAYAAEHLAGQRANHDVMLVNVIAELEARGVESPGGLSRVDWLRAHDPGLSAADAKAFVTVGRAVNEAGWTELRARVSMQHITVGKAAQIIEFHERTHRVADPDEVASAIDDLVARAQELPPEMLAKHVRHHTEQVRPPADSDRLDEGRRQSRGLWFAQPNATGMVRMHGVLDPEAAAIVKAAIDPLSLPRPLTDAAGRTVEPDPRSPAKRRADALLEIIMRGVSWPDGVPTTDAAKVVVLIEHEALLGRLGGAGVTQTGDVLSAATVRRLACDAAIIPMVLGGESEPLDVGRQRRLVTRAIRLALVARDAGCTFDGCTVPAQWCQAHHEQPWSLGGTTSLRTTALLCQRHHTHVHQHALRATITASTVTWHV